MQGNKSLDTGTEYRLQAIFGDELWLKLERIGLTPNAIKKLSVLEVCGGTGFLTYHLLARSHPKSFAVNDISASEMEAAKCLIQAHYPFVDIDWILGDMHSAIFDRKFDLIIGNSFLHHFCNVPQALSRFHELLNPGGQFITLHEPTPMSTVVEGAKILAWPLAVLAPEFVNNIARMRYQGEPSDTDLWMFESSKLKLMGLQAGFKAVDTHPWGLLRPILVEKYGLHMSSSRPRLSEREIQIFQKAIKADSVLNRFLPIPCFGSICAVYRK